MMTIAQLRRRWGRGSHPLKRAILEVMAATPYGTIAISKLARAVYGDDEGDRFAARQTILVTLRIMRDELRRDDPEVVWFTIRNPKARGKGERSVVFVRFPDAA